MSFTLNLGSAKDHEGKEHKLQLLGEGLERYVYEVGEDGEPLSRENLLEWAEPVTETDDQGWAPGALLLTNWFQGAVEALRRT